MGKYEVEIEWQYTKTETIIIEAENEEDANDEAEGYCYEEFGVNDSDSWEIVNVLPLDEESD